jgi:hypothetical protein
MISDKTFGPTDEQKYSSNARLFGSFPSVDWLAGWLAGWLTDWLAGWLAGWLLAGWLAGWLASR